MATNREVTLDIRKGGTLRKPYTYKAGTPAAAVDLTGYTARMQIRSDIDSATVLKELTTENGGIALGGIAGTIEFYISATDTAAFDFTTAVYDLELIAPITGDVKNLFGGMVILHKEVTR